MKDLAAVILAAGDGTRMKSSSPKVLKEVLFKPMIHYVVETVLKLGIRDIAVIVGAGAEEIKKSLEKFSDVNFTFVSQTQRLGTGHAVMQAKDFISNTSKDVIILSGDAPFIDDATISEAYGRHIEGAAVTVITARLQNPSGYGRILRTDGNFMGIAEQKDATAEQRTIDEINSGSYIFSSEKLLSSLDKLGNNNSQGEYYLTDTIEILRLSGDKTIAALSANPEIAQGANDRAGLLRLNEIANKKNIDRLLNLGVEFLSTDGILIGNNVSVAADTTILPGSILYGDVSVGSGCIIGPNTKLIDTLVGDNTTLDNVVAENCKVGNGCKVGPFAQIRPNSVLGDGVKLGNFTEVKNSVIGDKTSIAHLTYIGDCDVGERVNFGCGVVLVNYDGVNKFRSVIGDDSFIGCNTNIISPKKIGARAYTAAGTTVDKDVPDDALAIGRVRTEIKEGLGAKLRSSKLDKK